MPGSLLRALFVEHSGGGHHIVRGEGTGGLAEGLPCADCAGDVPNHVDFRSKQRLRRAGGGERVCNEGIVACDGPSGFSGPERPKGMYRAPFGGLTSSNAGWGQASYTHSYTHSSQPVPGVGQATPCVCVSPRWVPC